MHGSTKPCRDVLYRVPFSIGVVMKGFNDIDGELKAYIIGLFVFFLGIALIISSIAWPIVFYHQNKQEMMMKGGYEEVPNPSDKSSVLWKKVKEEK